jgi:TRAP-type C4-dicarboxylate transport system permease small subunit
LPQTDPHSQTAGAFAPANLIIAATDVLAAICLMAMMGVAFIDVVGRTFFNAPMPGATELTELMVGATICFILPSLAWRGLHATIDVLDVFVPQRLRPWQLGFADLLSGFCFGIVSWRIWIEGGKTAKYGGKTPLLEIPLAPVQYGISVMFAIAAMAFLLTIWRSNKGAGQ